jgi:CBS domain-containing protein
MKVQRLMSDPVSFCSPETDLGAAAMMMWENDCGILPVVESTTRKTVGVITDRDICMALSLAGCIPGERRVSQAMSRELYAVKPDDEVTTALHEMKEHQVRRLPVVDPSGGLVGLLSMNDIVLAAHDAAGLRRDSFSAQDVVKTLVAICRHRRSPAESAEVAVG